MTAYSALSGGRRDGAAGLRAWVPHLGGLSLPKSVERGNLSVNKSVIWWMPVNRWLDFAVIAANAILMFNIG